MASNLTRAEPVCLRRGSAAVAIRSSSAAPGVFAPVDRDGELLVDDLFLDNLPVELAQQRARGFTIAVNVIQPPDPSYWAALRGGGGTLHQALRMMNPLKGKWAPPIMELVMQCFFLSTVRDAERIRKLVDLYIEPRVQHLGFLDTASFERTAEAGYEASHAQILAWRRAHQELAVLRC